MTDHRNLSRRQAPHRVCARSIGRFWQCEDVSPLRLSRVRFVPYRCGCRRGVSQSGGGADRQAGRLRACDLGKALESIGVDRETMNVAMTYPLGFTGLELCKFGFALGGWKSMWIDTLIPVPLAVAYRVTVREGIDLDGMEFILADLDDTRCCTSRQAGDVS